jgi:hypothetical protein
MAKSTVTSRQPSKQFGTLPQWCADSGMGRTSTYAAISEGKIRAVKSGSRTLVDYASGFGYLNSLPAAQIRLTTSTKKSSS